MIRERQQQESRSPLLEDADRIRLASDANKSGRAKTRTKLCHRHAVRRLYLAIVSRAILDVLERDENSAAAEEWLLSRDFDRLQELFG